MKPSGRSWCQTRLVVEVVLHLLALEVAKDTVALDEVFLRFHLLAFPHLLHPTLLPFLLLLLPPHFSLPFGLLEPQAPLLPPGELQSEVRLHPHWGHVDLEVSWTRLELSKSASQPASNGLASHPSPSQGSKGLRHPVKELLQLDMALFDVDVVVAWSVDILCNLAGMVCVHGQCARPN